jgi:uncharacterized protein (UPF0332 family)
MKEEVELLFQTLFALERLRDIYRKTAPLHIFSEEEKREASSLLEEAQNCLTQLKKWVNERKGTPNL